MRSDLTLQHPVLRLHQAGVRKETRCTAMYRREVIVPTLAASVGATIRGKTPASSSTQAPFPESQSYHLSTMQGKGLSQNPDTSLLCLLCPPSLPPVAKRYLCSLKSLIQTLGCCISLFNLQFKFSDRQKQPSCSLKIARSYIEIQEIANASSSS